MTSKYPVVPLEQTDIIKLIPLMTLTKVAKIAVKSGTLPAVVIDAAIESGYTRQGAFAALRGAGVRERRVRSDKGKTLRKKLDGLIEQANALREKLAQSNGSGTSH
jgi:ABC-type amino acid transport substrate-binding protein